MEAPSLLSFLARVIPTPKLRAYSYAQSAFLDRDAENLSHAEWRQPYAKEETSMESFPDLYNKAKDQAISMIVDCFDFARKGTLSEEALRDRLGNRSYLSGLDVEDARNDLVPSLRPPKDPDHVQTREVFHAK